MIRYENQTYQKVPDMTPKQSNYRMPAEWEQHHCTFMEWPANEKTWGTTLPTAQADYANVARAIAQFEPVIMIVRPEQIASAVHHCGPSIGIWPMVHDDAWVRDNGPTFVIDPGKKIAGVNWKFNAWGYKNEHWHDDDQVAPALLQRLNVLQFDAPIVLEGGSIHVDGEGTVLATEQCLLNKNRNPHLNRSELETILQEYLNVEKIIWLKQGLSGDDTDGHVDNVACFIKPGTVMVQVCNDPDDPNFEITNTNLEILKLSSDAQGRSLKVIQVQQPPAICFQGHRLPLSYINFYLANGGLIFPRFGGECCFTDQLAETVFRQTFPERRIIGVDGMTIIKGGGNIHCITQQMPQGILPISPTKQNHQTPPIHFPFVD